MQVDGGLDYFADDESADVFWKSLSTTDILVKILPIYVLSDNVYVRLAL